MQIFSAIAETFILIAFGMLVYKFRMISGDDISKLSRFAFNFLMPFLCFRVVAENFTLEKISVYWPMPVIGFAFMFVGFAIGSGAKYLLKYDNHSRRVTFLHICAINNYLFLPLIVVENMYGGNSEHTSLLLVMNIGSTVGFWTIGIWSLKGVQGGSCKEVLANVFNVNVIAVFAAILVGCFNFTLPHLVSKICASVGGMAVPFTMLLTGCAMLKTGLGKLLMCKFDAVYLAFMRLIAIPIVLILLLKLLPLAPAAYQTCCIVAVMPAAVASVLISRINTGSDTFASQQIVLTTLLSAVTMPLLLKFVAGM